MLETKTLLNVFGVQNPIPVESWEGGGQCHRVLAAGGRLAGWLGGHLAANRFINPPCTQHNKVTLDQKKCSPNRFTQVEGSLQTCSYQFCSI